MNGLPSMDFDWYEILGLSFIVPYLNRFIAFFLSYLNLASSSFVYYWKFIMSFPSINYEVNDLSYVVCVYAGIIVSIFSIIRNICIKDTKSNFIDRYLSMYDFIIKNKIKSVCLYIGLICLSMFIFNFIVWIFNITFSSNPLEYVIFRLALLPYILTFINFLLYLINKIWYKDKNVTFCSIFINTLKNLNVFTVSTMILSISVCDLVKSHISDKFSNYIVDKQDLFDKSLNDSISIKSSKDINKNLVWLLNRTIIGKVILEGKNSNRSNSIYVDISLRENSPVKIIKFSSYNEKYKVLNYKNEFILQFKKARAIAHVNSFKPKNIYSYNENTCIKNNNLSSNLSKKDYLVNFLTNKEQKVINLREEIKLLENSLRELTVYDKEKKAKLNFTEFDIEKTIVSKKQRLDRLIYNPNAMLMICKEKYLLSNISKNVIVYPVNTDNVSSDNIQEDVIDLTSSSNPGDVTNLPESNEIVEISNLSDLDKYEEHENRIKFKINESETQNVYEDLKRLFNEGELSLKNVKLLWGFFEKNPHITFDVRQLLPFIWKDTLNLDNPYYVRIRYTSGGYKNFYLPYTYNVYNSSQVNIYLQTPHDYNRVYEIDGQVPPKLFPSFSFNLWDGTPIEMYLKKGLALIPFEAWQASPKSLINAREMPIAFKYKKHFIYWPVKGIRFIDLDESEVYGGKNMIEDQTEANALSLSKNKVKNMVENKMKANALSVSENYASDSEIPRQIRHNISEPLVYNGESSGTRSANNTFIAESNMDEDEIRGDNGDDNEMLHDSYKVMEKEAESANWEPQNWGPGDWELGNWEPGYWESQNWVPGDLEPINWEPENLEPINKEPENLEPINWKPEDLESRDWGPGDWGPGEWELAQARALEMWSGGSVSGETETEGFQDPTTNPSFRDAMDRFDRGHTPLDELDPDHTFIKLDKGKGKSNE